MGLGNSMLEGAASRSYLVGLGNSMLEGASSGNYPIWETVD